MENVLEWARSHDKSKRNKPPKQLQDELIRYIMESIRNGGSYKEAVEALVSFGTVATENFYANTFEKMTPPEREQWTNALLEWANSLRPTIPVTVRFVQIIQTRVADIQNVQQILPELRWLALHEDSRTINALKAMRANAEKETEILVNLRKLLSIDLTTGWEIGRAILEKYYSVLFADCPDEKTRELYEDFKKRNGISTPITPAEKTNSNDMPTQEKESTVDVDPSSASETASVDQPTEQKEESKEVTTIPEMPSNKEQPADTTESIKVTGNSTSEQKPIAEPEVIQAHNQNSAAVTPKTSPIQMAENLLKWVSDAANQIKDLQFKLSNVAISENHYNDTISGLRQRISDLGSKLTAADAEKTSLEASLRAEKAENEKLRAEIDTLHSEVTGLNDTVGQVQQMAGNSSKQELDGFKANLGTELSSIVKDMADLSDFSDTEKAEAYQALLEDMIDTLKHNGIHFEE